MFPVAVGLYEAVLRSGRVSFEIAMLNVNQMEDVSGALVCGVFGMLTETK